MEDWPGAGLKQLWQELSKMDMMLCGHSLQREDFVHWRREVSHLSSLHSQGSDKRISGISIGFKSSLQDDFCA